MFIIQHISNIGKDRYEVKRKRIKLCNQNINYYVEYQQRKTNQSDYLLRHGEPLSTLPRMNKWKQTNYLIYCTHQFTLHQNNWEYHQSQGALQKTW